MLKSSDVAQKKPILTFKHPNQYKCLIYKEKTVISDGLYSVAGVAGSRSLTKANLMKKHDFFFWMCGFCRTLKHTQQSHPFN